ncbi:MAG: type II toxin-antitoxin system HigB family toxin [Prosthecobacter sp.]|nr:type II toxin-antitoxin system HigB family toxin [Prosthecobacter sp.]
MRIIKPPRLLEFAREHPKSASSLLHWLGVAKRAKWRNLSQTRADFPHADEVRVSSHRPVTIFNISGNAFRLITAIHYDTGKLFILELLTHAEYSNNTWKNRL